MKDLVLGLHSGANASAAIGRQGRLLYCIQEERLTGIKGYMGFPHRAIEACLRHVDAEPADVVEVAYGSLDGSVEHCPPQEFLRRLRLVHAPRREPVVVNKRGARRALGMQDRVMELLAAVGQFDSVVFYDHHTTHAATAYYGLRADPELPYLVLTCDGFGDGACATVSVWQAGLQQELARTAMPDSLGMLYFWTTQEYGFVPHSEEFKLMGMAPYVAPAKAAKAAAVFRRWLKLSEDGLTFERLCTEPIEQKWPLIARQLRSLRFDAVFAGLQQFTEELLAAWVKAAIRATGVHDVLVAGGVFMNVKANQRIAALPEVASFAAFPSCGDESLPIGAFYLGCAKRWDHTALTPIADCYLGDDISDEEAAGALRRTSYQVERPEDMDVAVAELLAQGKVVARAVERMEFGARALGNRSILANPANADLPRILNQLIKRRDFWMPFAPVLLATHQQRYVINPKGLTNPFMMTAFDTVPSAARDMIAAVHPADLTCRAQLVSDMGSGIGRLLERYHERTGSAVLLNTSLNLHGQPMVRTAADALRVFGDSGLEHMQVGCYLVSKRAG